MFTRCLVSIIRWFLFVLPVRSMQQATNDTICRPCWIIIIVWGISVRITGSLTMTGERRGTPNLDRMTRASIGVRWTSMIVRSIANEAVVRIILRTGRNAADPTGTHPALIKGNGLPEWTTSCGMVLRWMRSRTARVINLVKRTEGIVAGEITGTGNIINREKRYRSYCLGREKYI